MKLAGLRTKSGKGLKLKGRKRELVARLEESFSCELRTFISSRQIRGQIEELPDNLIAAFFEHLDLGIVLRAACVCKKWFTASTCKTSIRCIIIPENFDNEYSSVLRRLKQRQQNEYVSSFTPFS